MDELKKYLRQHADKLDLDEPGDQVWQRISAGVTPGKKSNVVMMVTRWAAAACVLVLAGIGLWSVLHGPQQPAVTSAVVKTNVPSPTPSVPVPEQPSVKQQPVNEEHLIAKAQTRKPERSVKATTAGETKISPDTKLLNDVVSSFTQVINLQRARVSNMPMYAETPEYFSDFKLQMHQMENDEKAIKTDISKRGLNDELLGQLINLYQQKLNTLKQLQLEMNKTNNRFKQNRGPVDSTKTYFLNI